MQFSSIFLAVVAAVGAFAQTTASVAQTTGPAAVADPTINTPSGVQQCLPVQLTFSGTAPPFIITIVPAGQAGAAPLETVGASNGTSITWNANLPAGQNYTCVIRDSMGRTNPSVVLAFIGDSSVLDKPGHDQLPDGFIDTSIDTSTSARLR
ncbi:hypothetical protein FRC04_010087 [Tulasnella sp. 424]|nr:hypothetical protein FRC04_010087 [Tulasnella sp. 424]